MGSSAEEEKQVAAMDDMDALSLLELDYWLLDAPATLPVEDSALVRVQGGEIPQQPTPTALQRTEAANASERQRLEACQAPTGLQRLQGRDHADEPPPKKVKRGKSSSQRQKEEIMLLRQQAVELQAQAARLRGVDTVLTSDGASAAMVLDTAYVHSMWLDVAKRQQNEEKRAKEANAKLRDALKAHTKFVRRLDRVLRKAAVGGIVKYDPATIFNGTHSLRAQDWSVGSLPAQAAWLASTPSREDRSIFVSLARSVEEQVLPQFDDMMGRRWYLSPRGDVDLDRRYQNALGDRVAEAKDTTLLPFSHRMVDEVSWRSMRNGKLQFGLRADAVRLSFEVFFQWDTKENDKSCSGADHHTGGGHAGMPDQCALGVYETQEQE